MSCVTHTCFLLIACLALLLSISEAALVYERCISNSMCTAVNSFCDIFSPTCGAGTCSCLPSFETDDRRVWCKRSIGVNEACRNRYDNCHDPNSKCVDSKCTCIEGYKQAPYLTDCVKNSEERRSGESCENSDQCFNEMECTQGVCACPLGYKLNPKDPYRCIQSKLLAGSSLDPLIV